MKEKIMKALAENEHNYCCFGIRTDSRVFNVGDYVGDSHAFDYENGCSYDDQYLPGTCATGFDYLWFDGEDEDVETVEKAIQINSDYQGTHKYLIAGDDYECGNDEAEIIIRRAVVIAVLY